MIRLLYRKCVHIMPWMKRPSRLNSWCVVPTRNYFHDVRINGDAFTPYASRNICTKRCMSGVSVDLEVKDKAMLSDKHMSETNNRREQDIEGVMADYIGSASVLKITAILRRLSEVSNESTSVSLAQNKQYHQMLKTLNAEVLKLPLQVLFSNVLSLMMLHPKGDTEILQSLLTQLLWMMRKASISQIFHIHESFMHRKETPLRNKVRQTALESLMLRLHEISEPRIIISLMYSVDSEDKQNMTNLETRALELCDKMSTKELYRTLFYLAKHQRRNTPLLRSIVGNFKNKDQMSLSAQHLMNFGYALKTLSIFDKDLIEKWADALMDQIGNAEHKVEYSLLFSVLHTLGKLRFLNKEMLDKTAELISECEMLNLEDLSCFVMTCAVTGYVPNSFDDILRNNLQLLSVNSPKFLLDIAWSLTILNKLSTCEPLIGRILEDEFIRKIPELYASNTGSAYLKVMNIHAAATGGIDSKPIRNLIPFDKVKITHPSKRPVLDQVVQSLSPLAPGDKYMKLDVLHDTGHIIDVELKATSTGEFLPIESSHKIDNSLEYHRLAIKVLNFSDFTLGAIQPIGRVQLMADQLTGAGYTVVLIPYNEFLLKDTTVKQIQHLKDMIKKAVDRTQSC